MRASTVDDVRRRALPRGATLKEIERDAILQTIDDCKGNRTHAAQVLGMSIGEMVEKLPED